MNLDTKLPEKNLYNEKELLLRIANADERAFESLIERFGSTIYGHALMYLKDARLAQEVSQDILLNVWKHRSELPNIENFAGYVFVMTRNRVKTVLRKKIMSFAELPEDGIHSALAGTEAGLEYKELRDIINAGIEELPPRRKQIFKMSRFGGLSYDEIARQLNIGKSTVKDHVLEALVYLRAYMKEKHGIVLSALLGVFLSAMTFLIGMIF